MSRPIHLGPWVELDGSWVRCSTGSGIICTIDPMRGDLFYWDVIASPGLKELGACATLEEAKGKADESARLSGYVLD